MDSRSPMEHIGGLCVLGGVGLAFYDGGWWAALTITVGVVFIGLGWVVDQKKRKDQA